MNARFDARSGLIVIPVQIHGPAGVAQLRLALDTGATTTLVRPAHLEALGYDPALAQERVQMTTGSGVEFVLRMRVARICALGNVQENFAVLGHTLPPSATVDGLLGLDFLRGGRLEVDFRAGIVRFEP
jgi:predicted aspartyl protease